MRGDVGSEGDLNGVVLDEDQAVAGGGRHGDDVDAGGRWARDAIDTGGGRIEEQAVREIAGGGGEVGVAGNDQRARWIVGAYLRVRQVVDERKSRFAGHGGHLGAQELANDNVVGVGTAA